ncbi:MAG: helix-turn-helix domain-containing protein [Clostridia bacterium]|nr:helix-turn-helix domain-containing protein [Clostridia bacterium]
MKLLFDTCSEAIQHATETKSFGVFYSEKSKPSLQMHVHECCEIFFPLSEGNTFLIDGKVYDVKANDLFVINQFEAHKVSRALKEKFVRYSLHVHPTFLYSNSTHDINLAECFYNEQKISRISLFPNEAEDLKKLFLALLEDYGYGDELYKKIRATEILLTVNRLFSLHNESEAQTVRHRALQLAIDYINAHYNEDLTLEIIAKCAYISVNQLCRLFNQYCSTTVTKYLISKRITEAKKLLADGKSVTEVAFACGFNDYANFIRTFKNAVGISPGKYKNTIA